NFISLMPTNLYGPNDNFDLKNSHVLPALLRKFHEAKINKKSSVTLWGTGNPLREFLHVNDLAKACIHFMLTYNEKSPVNIGTGKDISIHELASEIKKIVGFEGEILWDKNKPDGTPRKLLDVTKAKQGGWESSITLLDGIRMTYDWYVQNKGK
ncbi:MAG: NAD-dependent epimerase/dehydratase family protein, partial [Bacteroidota bacterium]|nr:NAD-dependent epimerase/dehydratase family protein [Bacteroidota bacterium]